MMKEIFLEKNCQVKGGNIMHSVSGHEMNTVHDLKKLTLLLTQATLDELHKEGNKKIQITTSHCLIIADKINTQEPIKDEMTLLEQSILEAEDTLHSIINEGNITNLYGMILLRNVKIIPFASPDKVVELESYALYMDHIMGFSITD
jgi:hypothetical protein